MACKSCEERRQRMKAYIAAKLETAKRWAQVRAGNATPATSVQPAQAKRTTAPAEGSGQAADAGTAHGNEGMAPAKGSRAGAGRVSVPRVRKDSGGKTGAR